MDGAGRVTGKQKSDEWLPCVWWWQLIINVYSVRNHCGDLMDGLTGGFRRRNHGDGAYMFGGVRGQ